MDRSLRVIQCGTGIAGAQALATILERPNLELVGLLVHSATNENKDAGRFVDAADCGVVSTRDVEKLVKTPADVVLYMLLVPDLDDICAFLASGKNVITTAGFMFPSWNNPQANTRLEKACRVGGTSFHVTGINPGFVDEVLPLTLSMLSRDWTTCKITEYADCSTYPSIPMLRDVMGFGRTPEEVAAGKVADMSVMTDFFAASVAALGHGLGIQFDAVNQDRQFQLAKRDFTIAGETFREGTIAGQRWRWAGVLDGVERIVQETFWIAAFDLGDGYPASGDMEGDVRWTILIEGNPALRCVFETAETFADGVSRRGNNLSSVATAMAAVNRIGQIAAARTGVITSADLGQPAFMR